MYTLAKKHNESTENVEKIKAPVHKRKKDGKKKQMTKQKIREKLAKLQNEALESVEKNNKKSKEIKKEEPKLAKHSSKNSRKQKSFKQEKKQFSIAPVIAKDPREKVRIIPLGGLNEIGKNITAIECGDDIIIIDCGFGFPDEVRA